MRSRTTGGLIVVQIAMTFVLLVAGVMFARIPGMVTAMDPGFETRQTLSIPPTIDTSPQNRSRALNLYHALEARIRAIPGVQSLAYATARPFRQGPPSEIRLPQQATGQGEPATIDNVSTGFFSTFGIRMMAGRSFLSSDPTSSNASSVAVVSQAFAKQFWPGKDPIGKLVITPDEKHYEVVGVAADTRSERFGVLDGPRLYTLRDPSGLDGQLYVRFKGTASTTEKAVYDAVKSLDHTQETTPQTIWEELEADAESVRSLARISCRHGFDCRTARRHGRLRSAVVRCQSTYTRVRRSFGAGREPRHNLPLRSAARRPPDRGRIGMLALRSRYRRCGHLLAWLEGRHSPFGASTRRRTASQPACS